MASKAELLNEDVEIIVFAVGGINCGLPISEVKEIIKTKNITLAKGSAPYVTGVINLRGAIVTIVDLRIRLGLEVDSTQNAVYILLVRFKDELIGLQVDRIEDSIYAHHKDFFPAPANLNNQSKDREFFRSAYKRDKDLVAILNLENCLLESGS